MEETKTKSRRAVYLNDEISSEYNKMMMVARTDRKKAKEHGLRVVTLYEELTKVQKITRGDRLRLKTLKLLTKNKKLQHKMRDAIRSSLKEKGL